MWAIASLALLAVLFVIDLATGDDALLAATFAAAPALAAIGSRAGVTGGIAVVATACALISGFVIGDAFDREDAVRTVTVLLVGNLSVWAALLREHMLESSASVDAQEARYSTLLRALSEAGEGLVVLEGERAVYVNEAFEQLTWLTA